jgi:FOG: Ankyrin repeat
MAAVFKGHYEVVEMLLSALVANDAWDVLTMANRNGDTCLGLAVSIAPVRSSSSSDNDDNGNDDGSRLIRLLLDWEERLAPEEYCTNHADRTLHCKNALGLTPLLVACERDNLNIVKLLLSKAGADMINTVDKDGRSPLAIASFCGCLDVLDYLLGTDHVDSSSLVNRKDSNGCTPIWLAARTGNVQVVRKLIHAGADATIPNNAGLSAMDVAEKYQKQQVLDFFRQELPCIVTHTNTVQ